MQIFPRSLTVKTIKFKRNEYDDDKVGLAGLNCWASYATGYNYSSWQIHDDLEVLLNNFSDTVVVLKKYKTFSVLIYSYINTSGNWKNEKLCGNTTPAGRSVFTQFRVFPIFTSVDITVYQYGKNVLYFIYNIAQRTLTKEWREIFRVDIELYQHGS